MPLNKHFGGHGEEVMDNMKKEYGGEKAEKVFYATENKNKGKAKKTSGRSTASMKALE
jgi:hypothetical protein